MFEKMKLKKAIRECKETIEDLERRRNRSQAALMEAILLHEDPNDEDVEYFNSFTAKIEEQRELMHSYMARLSAL